LVQPFFPEYIAIFPRKLRRYFLYIHGKIGLTLWALPVSLSNALDEMSKPKEICHTKGRATGCKLDAGVKWSQAGPGRRESPDMIRRLVKGDTIFSPIVPIAEHFKLLTVQGMEGMCHRENSFRKRWRWCS
jgi:hypothetical protein